MEEVNLISSSSNISKIDMLHTLLKNLIDGKLQKLEKRSFFQLEDIKKCYDHQNSIIKSTDSCFVMLQKHQLMLQNKLEASMKRNVSVRSGINTLNTSVASTSRRVNKNSSTIKTNIDQNSANANKSTSKYGNVSRITKDKERNLRPLSPESSTTNVKQLEYNKSRPKLNLNKNNVNDKSMGKNIDKPIIDKLETKSNNREVLNKANFENLKRSKTKPKVSDKDSSGKFNFI